MSELTEMESLMRSAASAIAAGNQPSIGEVFEELQKRNARLEEEIKAMRSSVRQKSILATEQKLREVTAERDQLRGWLRGFADSIEDVLPEAAAKIRAAVPAPEKALADQEPAQ